MLLEPSMNQTVFSHISSPPARVGRSLNERCNLPMLTEIILSSMTPILGRRKQDVVLQPTDKPVVIEGDLYLVFSLLSAVVLETAGLSSANAVMRVSFDADEEAAMVTIAGANYHQIAPGYIQLDQQLSDLAAEGGANLTMIWNEHEGPTLVLRFPKVIQDKLS
jgi:hypothetical protein